MKEYDLIVVGTGSAMNLVDPILQSNPDWRIAVIDKDEPGGICLTRGCIPTKILVYPAELVRTIESAGSFGIDVTIDKVDFQKVMERMRSLIGSDISMIDRGLRNSPSIDYYPTEAEFVEPYTLRVGRETIRSNFILLCAGSKPLIPPIKGIEKSGFHTSDTILQLNHLPKELIIVGGGYIAAEYGHFFSAMGSRVTIVGRNRQFLKSEEPEVSSLALRKMSKHMTILTNHEVISAHRGLSGKKSVTARNRTTDQEIVIKGDDILVASGRSSLSDILLPVKGGIAVDENGWILTDEHLETNQPGVWAFGDCIGKHLFKHTANYESMIVYENAVLGKKRSVEYFAVPHAVFTEPEIASVGFREAEAIEQFEEENVIIGFQKFENTAKGEAMGLKDFFVKVIMERGEGRILGAHIIGPQASVLIQEIINIMYTENGTFYPIYEAQHIHPALPEVVHRAITNQMVPAQYHHMLTGKHNGHHQ